MKNEIKEIIFIISIFSLFLISSCNNNNNQNVSDITLSISTTLNNYYVNDNIIIDLEINKNEYINDVELYVKDTSFDVDIINNVIIPNHEGTLTVYAKAKDAKSNEITLNIKPSIYDGVLYTNVSNTDFYNNYKESINPKDIYYRTIKGFMSGDIILPDQRPTRSVYAPIEDNKFVRNTNAYYSTDKKTYYITDGYGEIVDMIFSGGAYKLTCGHHTLLYIIKKKSNGNPFDFFLFILQFLQQVFLYFLLVYHFRLVFRNIMYM